MATVVECSKISPAPGALPEFSLPMVFFDMAWYGMTEIQSVFFFELACSKSHFLENIVPDLKKSLSFTLSHFVPLAGKIIHPLNPEDKPTIHYESGDSVCFKVTESSADFDNLIGYHSRNCDEFYAFAPHLPPATRSEKSISCPISAVQVTLFPGKGICIGFINHHAVVDASTFNCFIQAWALINRSMRSECDDGADSTVARLLEGNCLPFFDRKTVTNLHGLDSIYWDHIVKFSKPVEPFPLKLPTNKLRATFVLKKDEIQKLKKFISGKCADIAHLSSFTVACALAWVCSAKSAALGGDEVADNEPEYFGFMADCRGRLEPSLPANYFGNCLALIRTVLTHGVLKGADGFVMAAMAIGKAIKEDVYSDKGILFGAENWLDFGKLIGRKRVHQVAGSPKFDFCNADYGWGKPNKHELIFSDVDGSILMFISKSRNFLGGLEISMSKTKVQMDGFARFLDELLMDLLQSSNNIIGP